MGCYGFGKCAHLRVANLAFLSAFVHVPPAGRQRRCLRAALPSPGRPGTDPSPSPLARPRAQGCPGTTLWLGSYPLFQEGKFPLGVQTSTAKLCPDPCGPGPGAQGCVSGRTFSHKKYCTLRNRWVPLVPRSAAGSDLRPWKRCLSCSCDSAGLKGTSCRVNSASRI